MVGRIIEVASDGVHLSTERGFLKLSLQGDELGKVAFDQIEALIAHGHGVTFSSNLISRLSDHGIPLITCGANHAPIAITWPIGGHYAQGFRMEAQASASLPLKKRIWKDLIKAKINNQALVLNQFDLQSARLIKLGSEVRTGDETNCEALAAQYYWPQLMGPDFKRDRSEPGINQLLNYGYMVLRAATARSIVAAGLHPSLSVHHQSRGNPLRLSDDLMEPFRPFVDWIVKECVDAKETELNKETKAKLASLPRIDLKRRGCVSPLQICLDSAASTLAQIYLKECQTLDLPLGLHQEAAE
ncbi:MAG: CRISPR-associated endonuclease Cas1 [Rhodomicrobium sp.]|nr:MAG: CRISPR-associated endonuclease Cas1 [Rhodomicrobium sp.]